MRAIIVEDDLEQQVRHREALSKLGFRVDLYSDARSARAAPKADGIVDLLVLDRRLPYEIGGRDNDDVGDQLLEYLLDVYPDSAFIVFTGQANVSSAERATRGRGEISVSSRTRVDRVQHFQKSEGINFANAVRDIAEAIRSVDAVEVIPVQADALSRRILARVTLKFGGLSCTVKPFDEGQTDARVWHCQVESDQGLVANVVVKASRKPVANGALESLLPANVAIARALNRITGMLDGMIVTTFPLAGTVEGSLFHVSEESGSQAVNLLRSVRLALDPIASYRKLVDLQSLIQPLISWSKFEERLIESGVRVPDSRLGVSVCAAAQHGDLHAGNILVCSGSPVVIDLDSQAVASRLLDPLCLYFGMAFNGSSPHRDHPWRFSANMGLPQQDEESISRAKEFHSQCPAPDFMQSTWEWLAERATSPREYWGLTAAYMARQLGFRDVQENDVLREEAKAILAFSIRSLVQ